MKHGPLSLAFGSDAAPCEVVPKGPRLAAAQPRADGHRGAGASPSAAHTTMGKSPPPPPLLPTPPGAQPSLKSAYVAWVTRCWRTHGAAKVVRLHALRLPRDAAPPGLRVLPVGVTRGVQPGKVARMWTRPRADQEWLELKVWRFVASRETMYGGSVWSWELKFGVPRVGARGKTMNLVVHLVCSY